VTTGGKKWQEDRSPRLFSVVQFSDHEIDWEGVKILDKKSIDVKRKIKEAIHIRCQRPVLNRDGDK